MQTAIDWYFDKIKSHFEHDGDLLETATFTYAIAKQKEKQQIKDAWFDGYGGSAHSEDEYYNETYVSKGSDEIGQSLEWNGEVTQGSDDQVPDVRKMVEDDNYLTPVDWLMDRIKWIHRETYDYLIKDGQYDRAKRMESSTSSQTEISDEEIEKQALSYFNEHHCNVFEYDAFIAGVKWYREQLKKK